jgi:hypothetical protein
VPLVHLEMIRFGASGMIEELEGGAGSRYTIFIIVLMLHAVLVALLVLLQTRMSPRPEANPLELVFLAPVPPPKVSVPQIAFRGPRADIRLEILPPVNDTAPIPMSAGRASLLNGDQSGVDWTAEARRALQAFEIRSHQLSGNKSVSARPEEDNWMPSGRHHAGEQLRIANGDWIVWIDANCYKVASAGPGTRGVDYKILEVICGPKTRVKE